MPSQVGIVASATPEIIHWDLVSKDTLTPYRYDHTTVDDATNVATTTSGTKVGRWRDLNKVGPDLLAYSTAAQPTYMINSGIAGIRFSGAHALTCAAASAPQFVTSNATWFMVLTCDNSSYNVMCRFNGTNGWLLYTWPTSYTLVVGSASMLVSTPAATNRYVLAMRIHQGSSTFSTWCNGSAPQNKAIPASVSETSYPLALGPDLFSMGISNVAEHQSVRAPDTPTDREPLVFRAFRSMARCIASSCTKKLWPVLCHGQAPVIIQRRCCQLYTGSAHHLFLLGYQH